MSKRDDDVQRVRIVGDRLGSGLTRGTVILLVLSIALIVVTVNMEFGDHTPRYRPDPGPSPFLQSLAWVFGGIGALLALGLLVWLARRYGSRLLGALRHDLGEARVWLRESRQ